MTLENVNKDFLFPSPLGGGGVMRRIVRGPGGRAEAKGVFIVFLSHASLKSLLNFLSLK